MKASTLIVISIALLIGLSAAAAAKHFGLFEKKQAETAQVKEEAVMVMVANKDLTKNVAITSADVRVRELRADEKGFYEQNRAKLMPAITSAAHLKVPVDKIRADMPLLRSNFQEEQPDPVSLRLEDGMRAIAVSVPKERSAGGVIYVGEYVDVLLTSKIVDDARTNKTTLKTVLLDRNCRVIMKRNNPRILSQADPDGAPISFTLQANPYRAALIEYAQHRGIISLVPVPNKDTRVNEYKPRETGMMPVFSDMTSKEYRDEDQRVTEIQKGDRVIGDTDLERIFAVLPPPPGIPPIRVSEIRGIGYVGDRVFPQGGTGPNPASRNPTLTPGGKVSFDNPNEKDKDCPTCGKKKDLDQFSPLPMGPK